MTFLNALFHHEVRDSKSGKCKTLNIAPCIWAHYI